jgi:Arginine repressor, DNA binding domain
MQNLSFHSPGMHRAHEERREALLRIVREGLVGRQADLVRRLQQAGYAVTQSSVSRDLRDLGVAKVGDRYVLPGETPAPAAAFSAVATFVVAALTAGPNPSRSRSIRRVGRRSLAPFQVMTPCSSPTSTRPASARSSIDSIHSLAARGRLYAHDKSRHYTDPARFFRRS